MLVKKHALRAPISDAKNGRSTGVSLPLCYGYSSWRVKFFASSGSLGEFDFGGDCEPSLLGKERSWISLSSSGFGGCAISESSYDIYILYYFII